MADPPRAVRRKPGLNIVAEGVETQEQADLMIGKGVHFLQGYLFSPPVPGEKFVTEWVKKGMGVSLGTRNK